MIIPTFYNVRKGNTFYTDTMIINCYTTKSSFQTVDNRSQRNTEEYKIILSYAVLYTECHILCAILVIVDKLR